MGPVPRGVLMALLAGRAAAAGISWNINAGMKQCFLRGSYKTNPGFCHRRQCWHHLLTHSQIGDPASLESTAILQLMIAAHGRHVHRPGMRLRSSAAVDTAAAAAAASRAPSAVGELQRHDSPAAGCELAVGESSVILRTPPVYPY